MDSNIEHALERSSLLRGLARDERRAILEQGRERQARRHEVFLRQGEPAECLFLCLAGRVKITQTSEAGDEIILRVITPGEIFGGFGVLIDVPYPATALALETSVAVSWSKAPLVEILDRHPRLARNLMTILAHRLRETEERLRELATERVSQRLAHALLRLTRTAGRRVDTGVLIDLRLSREELAQMSGTTLFSVSRLLSEWQESGLVGSLRGRIVLRDPHRLVGLADELLPAVSAPKSPSRGSRRSLR